MDDIIKLIVIVIAILSLAGKFKAKQHKANRPKPQKTGGWITKLNAYLEEMQKRVEQQAGPSETPEQDDMDAPGISDKHTAADDELGDLELELVEEPEQPKTKKVPEAIKVRQGAPTEPQLAPDTLQTARVRLSKRRRFKLPANPSDLRTAVIWSEIIGPPLALRDQRSDNR
ncbi:MAG: hypothetical protein PVJ19_17435 [Desulfobacteraceae bacterium]|jgi:hypothetical protein